MDESNGPLTLFSHNFRTTSKSDWLSNQVDGMDCHAKEGGEEPCNEIECCFISMLEKNQDSGLRRLGNNVEVR